MQKNNRFHINKPQKSKTNNKTNRSKTSENLFYKFAVASLLTAGIALIVFVGFIKNTASAKTDSTNKPIQIASNQPVRDAEYKTISYDRPAESDVDISYEGEVSDVSETASNSSSATGNNPVDAQIQAILKTSSAAFLPTMWAHFGKINTEFGFRRNPFGGRSVEFHAGLDIDGNTGDTIVAPANGIVVKAEWAGGYGNMIEIDHGNGLTTRYGHLSRIGTAVGSAVQRGQLIGLVGSTGRSTGAHLHFEIRLNDKPINPRRFLSTAAATEIARLH